MADITGDDLNNTLAGSETADSIRGLGGNDFIYGGQGDDRLLGGDGDDFVYDGNAGGDTAPDSDVLEGGAGNDRLYHYQGSHFQDNDTLLGGGGDDVVWLYGTQTGCSVNGGTGFDEIGLILQGTSSSVFANLNTNGFTISLDGIGAGFVTGCERAFFWTGTAADSISGGENNDRLVSEGGADTIKAGAGDDEVEIRLQQNGAAQSAMSLNGGGGEDRLRWFASFYSSAAYNLDFQDDVFELGGNSLGTITGFEALSFEGGAGGDTVDATAGNDVLIGGDGNDSLTGYDGHDAIYGDTGANTMSGGDGNDIISLDPGADHNILDGGDGDDDLGAYYGGTHSLNGGAGNDNLSGNPLCEFDGGAGDDFYSINTNNLTNPLDITDASGVDTVRVFGPTSFSLAPYGMIENAEFYGASLTGNDLDNVLLSLTGNATVDGGRGDDTVAGDSGNDTLFGGAGDDLLAGDEGSGIGFGTGEVVKAAGAGNTSIATAIDVTDDFILENDPNVLGSTIWPHVTITATGDGSHDFYALEIARAGVWVTLDIDRAGLSGVFDSLMRVRDESGAVVYENDDSASYNGGGGSTSELDSYLMFRTPYAGKFYVEIASFDGAGVPANAQYLLQVSVATSNGNDVLDGGAGIDRLDGGQGLDTASFSDVGGRVIATTTRVSNDGFGNEERMVGIENLEGSRFRDRLGGDSGANRLDGGAGGDQLKGGGGGDTLVGGMGADKLTGGSGGDVFAFASLREAKPANKLETILDLNRTDGDKIDLSAIDALARGEDDAFTFIGTDDFSGDGGELRFEVIAGKTIIYADTNGGDPDLQIALDGVFTLTEDDFVL
jgi:Ca2+-binding RTX toxin-like protein